MSHFISIRFQSLMTPSVDKDTQWWKRKANWYNHFKKYTPFYVVKHGYTLSDTNFVFRNTFFKQIAVFSPYFMEINLVSLSSNFFKSKDQSTYCLIQVSIISENFSLHIQLQCKNILSYCGSYQKMFESHQLEKLLRVGTQTLRMFIATFFTTAKN